MLPQSRDLNAGVGFDRPARAAHRPGGVREWLDPRLAVARSCLFQPVLQVPLPFAQAGAEIQQLGFQPPFGLEERVRLLRRWGQPSEIQPHPSQERDSVRVPGWPEARLLKLAQHEIVDGIARRFGILNWGPRRFLDWAVEPMSIGRRMALGRLDGQGFPDEEDTAEHAGKQSEKGAKPSEASSPRVARLRRSGWAGVPIALGDHRASCCLHGAWSEWQKDGINFRSCQDIWS